jgi:hypothetical protein
MRHPRLALSVLATTLLLALLASAGVASAAVAPAEWQSVDVTLYADENPPLYLAAGVLPASVTLPADVQLLAPEGAQPQWLGEILGQDPSMDISVEPSVTTEGKNSVYSFEVNRSRTVQLEATLPNAVTTDGELYRTSVTWPAPQDAAEVRLSARLPKDAEIVESAEGATLVTDDPTVNYYTRTFKNVKAGNPVSIVFAYKVAAIGAAPAGPATSTLRILLFAGLAVAVIALGVVLLRSRRAPGSDDDLEEPAGIPDSEPASEGFDAEESEEPDADSAGGEAGEAGEPDAPDAMAVDASDDTPRRRGVSPKLLMGVVVTGALVIAGVAAAMNGTAPKASAEGITKQFAPGEACTVAEIPLELESGDEAEATRIFAAVANVPGIVYGTVHASESIVEVGYCESEATEEQLREALQQAGFALGAAPVDAGAPAGADASGTP